MVHREHQNGKMDMGHAGNDHHAMMIAYLQKRIWVTLVLTVPVMFFLPMIQNLMGIHLDIPGPDYLLAVLASVIFLYGGWPFLKGWYEEMEGRKPGMMTLI
jgi:Cu2+-exporting ATPase